LGAIESFWNRLMEQDDVMDFLKPWLARIYAPFPRAMMLYNEEYPSKIRAEHTDSVAAHNVHCHIVPEFEQEFSEESGFHFLKVRGFRVLNIQDRIVACWKKVDEEGLHRNHDSKQQRLFDAQEQLPELPAAVLRVTFGYEPDPVFSRCERVMVARPQGQEIVWAAQIIEDRGVCSWQDITPARLPGMTPRLRGIRFSKK
jgi:hypothetical protein